MIHWRRWVHRNTGYDTALRSPQNIALTLGKSWEQDGRKLDGESRAPAGAQAPGVLGVPALLLVPLGGDGTQWGVPGQTYHL